MVLSKDLKAYIKIINSQGSMDVYFTNDVYVPANWSQFNESVLHLRVSDDKYIKDNSYNFTWAITQFS